MHGIVLFGVQKIYTKNSWAKTTFLELFAGQNTFLGWKFFENFLKMTENRPIFTGPHPSKNPKMEKVGVWHQRPRRRWLKNAKNNYFPPKVRSQPHVFEKTKCHIIKLKNDFKKWPKNGSKMAKIRKIIAFFRSKLRKIWAQGKKIENSKNRKNLKGRLFIVTGQRKTILVV